MINPNSTKFLFILGIVLLIVSGIFQNNSLIMGFSFLVGLLFILISIIKLFVNKFFKSVNTGLSQKFWPIMGIFLLLFFTICYFADKDSTIRNQQISKSETTTPTPTLSTESIQQDVNEKLNVVTQPQEVTPTTIPLVTNKPTAKPTTPPTPKPTVIPISNDTVSQKNAVKKAKSYLNYTAFSHDGLVAQLEYEQFSHSDAVYGADNSGANWNEQAAKKAKQYMAYSAFSRGSLIEQLRYDKFTQEQAEYGANTVGL